MKLWFSGAHSFSPFLQLGLNCYVASNGGPVPPNSCQTTSDQFCYIPDLLELKMKGEEGLPSHNFPLFECEGTCRSDDECIVSESNENLFLRYPFLIEFRAIQTQG